MRIRNMETLNVQMSATNGTDDCDPAAERIRMKARHCCLLREEIDLLRDQASMCTSTVELKSIHERLDQTAHALKSSATL